MIIFETRMKAMLTAIGFAEVVAHEYKYQNERLELFSDELTMEPCCALKYYPAVDACQSEKVLISITLSIKIDKITLLKANPPLLSTAKRITP